MYFNNYMYTNYANVTYDLLTYNMASATLRVIANDVIVILCIAYLMCLKQFIIHILLLKAGLYQAMLSGVLIQGGLNIPGARGACVPFHRGFCITPGKFFETKNSV